MGNYQNGYGNKCPICGEEDIDINCNSITDKYFFYKCPNCGKFLAPDIDYDSSIKYPARYPEFPYNREHLKSYIFYHKSENRPFLAPSEAYDAYDKSGYVRIYNLTPDMVENWYPKTFAEQIATILLYFNEQQKYFGEIVKYTYEELANIFFAQPTNKDLKHNSLTSYGTPKVYNQIQYIRQFFDDNELVKLEDTTAETWKPKLWNQSVQVTILPKGISRIEELQRHNTNNKKVFIAMSFNPAIETIYNARTHYLYTLLCKVPFGFLDVVLDALHMCYYPDRDKEMLSYNIKAVSDIFYKLRYVADFSVTFEIDFVKNLTDILFYFEQKLCGQIEIHKGAQLTNEKEIEEVDQKLTKIYSEQIVDAEKDLLKSIKAHKRQDL